MSNSLSPEKGLIFRIVHRANVPWILDHVPMAALLGVGCYDSNAEEEIKTMVKEEYPDFRIYVRPSWYF